ncbi:MAG TPA: hypothetical protein VHC22_32610 [Pirellulales bacterium]|nr:hypothetical protein [Pirellulales bacterium]
MYVGVWESVVIAFRIFLLVVGAVTLAGLGIVGVAAALVYWSR